jgi:hypothetical protein
MKMPISELMHLSNEDMEARIRERIVDAMVLTGKPQLAISVMWNQVCADQTGDAPALTLSLVEVA